MRRLSLFWRFQIVGWTAFIITTFPTRLLVCGSLADVVGSILLRDGLSFLITLLMREIYRGIYRCHKEPAWLLGAILIVSSAAAVLQLPPYFWLGRIFPFEEKTIFGQYAAFGIFAFRGGQFLGWSSLYFGIKTWLEKQADHKKLQEEHEIRQRVELQMLRSLVNSHFLTNSLSLIAGTLNRELPGAREMIQALSSYLNYSLKHRWEYVVPIAAEVEALNNYLILQKAQLGAVLDFSIRVEDGLASAKVPGFVLQPLVENAIKYGREANSRSVLVRVCIRREETGLVIQVCNTGRWIKPDPYRQSGGVGIETIKRQFRWLYPGRFTFTTLQEEGWVTIETKIPFTL